MRPRAAIISSRLSFISNPNHFHVISDPSSQCQRRSFQHLNTRSLLTLLSNYRSSRINPPSGSPISARYQNPWQNPSFTRFFSSSNRTYPRKQRSRNHGQAHRLGIDSDELTEVVELIGRDEVDMELKLTRKNLNFSSSIIAEIFRSLNDVNMSALRFFNWVLSSPSGFKPTPEIYNLLVDNLGRSDDFSTMLMVLNELSSKQHCLTEKAFTFLTFRSSSSLNDSVRRVIETLNKVGGSCRGSGIYSLITVLCRMFSFDLAVFVMEQTIRKTSYYNVLIAAKCCKGDFQDARNVLDEMRRVGCDPNISSYNYLLGSLFKHKRVVEACDLMETMEGMCYVPDPVTFEVVTVHACMENRMDFALEFLNRMLTEGIRPRLTTHAAFIKGYFSSGRLEDAHKYVVEMSTRDKGSANMNYSLLARLFWASGRMSDAGRILHEMMEKGLKPNFPVYVKVMKDLHKISRGDMSSTLKSMFLKFTSSKEAG